jgi:hypothetical protein
MADRLDGVLTELLAAQDNETAAMPSSEDVPNTDPAAEGGNDAVTEGTPATENEGAEAPITDGEGQEGGSEVLPESQPDPQIDALTKATEALNGMRGENAQLRQMLEQMQQTMMQQQKAQSEANKVNEEKIAEAILEPPTLDFEQVQYMSDEERQAALSKYNSAVAEYTKKTVMKELQPLVDQYHRQTKEAENAAVKNQLIGSGKFEGFSDDADQIEHIISVTPGLADLPAETRYALGYVINRGVKAMNTVPTSETTDELVARVLKNPDAMKAIEKDRVMRVAQSNKAAPPVAASQGQNNAPALSQNPPKRLDEARAVALKMLGLK